MFKSLKSLCAIALATTTSVAMADDNTRIRFIHAAPGAGAVHVNHGDRVLFSNVQPQSVSSFIPSGDDTKRKIVLTAVQGGQKIEGNIIDFDDDNKDYTIIAMAPKDAGGQPQIKVIESSPAKPDQNRAQVSLINASSLEGADLFVGDNKVQHGINPGEIGTGTVDVSQAAAVRVVDDQNSRDIPVSNASGISAGKSYTVVVFSASNAQVVDDAAPAQGAGSGAGAAAAGAGATAGSAVTTGSAAM